MTNLPRSSFLCYRLPVDVSTSGLSSPFPLDEICFLLKRGRGNGSLDIM